MEIKLDKIKELELKINDLEEIKESMNKRVDELENEEEGQNEDRIYNLENRIDDLTQDLEVLNDRIKTLENGRIKRKFGN